MKPQHQNTSIYNFQTFAHTSKAWNTSQPHTLVSNCQLKSKPVLPSFNLNTQFGSNQTTLNDYCNRQNDNFQNFNSYSTAFSNHQQSTYQGSNITQPQHFPSYQPSIQHYRPTNQSKLPSIKELLHEIEVTVRKEEIINVANTIPEKTTSFSIKDQNMLKENQRERRNELTTNQFTTHHIISSSIRTENTNTHQQHNYKTNHVDNNGISNFGNKKICKQKSTRYLSETANLILKQWLYDNWHNPYPDQNDKQYLSKIANITVAQVNNYFINARRRVCKKMKNPPSSINALP